MTRARTRARLAAAALVTAALLLVGGCTGSPAPAASGPEPTATGTGTAVVTALDPDGIRESGVVVVSGAAALSVWPTADGVAGEPDEDGAVPLTAAVPQGAGWGSLVPVLRVVGPEGTTLERLDDGSAVLRDGTGRAVGAVTAPVLGGAAAGSGLRVQAVESDGTLVWQVTVPVRTDGTVEDLPGGTVTATFAGSAVRDATWRDLEDEGGRSLAVVPATWARGGSLAAEELLRAQLTASDPEAGTATMRDQLTCHLIGATDKASWNLEPWRPDVGLLGMIGALCNPE